MATVFTQSVEPGSGTSCTLMPPFSNQPSLVAMANGAAADDTVRAHQPTRTVVSADAGVTAAANSASDNSAIVFFMTLLPFLPLQLPH